MQDLSGESSTRGLKSGEDYGLNHRQMWTDPPDGRIHHVATRWTRCSEVSPSANGFKGLISHPMRLSLVVCLLAAQLKKNPIQILMIIPGDIRNGPMNKQLDFGGK